MKPRHAMPHHQTGSVLLEALISILIFSIGVLALIGTSTISTTKAGDAKYRVDASLLANELIGQMWVSDRTQATLQTNFNSPGGGGYTAWASHVQATLPGVVGALLPTVAVSAVNSTTTPSSYVTIQIQWQAPSDKTPHRYVAVAQVL